MKAPILFVLSALFAVWLAWVVGMEIVLESDRHVIIPFLSVQYGTIRTVTDEGPYVIEDWSIPGDRIGCGQVTAWKDYTYLPNKRRGYKTNVWGQNDEHLFGTLKDAEQYVEKWCKP